MRLIGRKAAAVFAAAVLSLASPTVVMANISALQAREIALAMTGGGVLTRFERVQDAGLGAVYNFTVANGERHYEVAISAQTGLSLAFSSTEHAPVAEPAAAGQSVEPAAAVSPVASGSPGWPRRILGIFTPNISRDQAVEIAYAHFASRNIDATFLNDAGIGLEQGRWVWGLAFLNGTGRGVVEIYIGTRNGDVVYMFDSGQ
ncbi:MAG: PepSY domain-containing protein [Spirochaetes bacterium]|nr:PepSY domain-containing protein [Spirochaetota bacterium]